MALIPFLIVLALLVAYLYHVNRSLSETPPEAARISQKLWTDVEIREEYRRVLEIPTDVVPYLKSKTGRRYIVAGGSGLVGGWIVQHLLMRGEDPAAIRILDLKEPTRPEIKKQGVGFIKTDVTDPSSVQKAFDETWKTKEIASRPLTVFHTVGYIICNSRKKDFLPLFMRIHVQGTQNILESAKSAEATVCICTSSGSVGGKSPSFFLPPWQKWPSQLLQFAGNADPASYDAPLEDYNGCYAYSKAKAELLVRQADNPKTGFRTGCIRPGHAIYGHGVENPSSLTWDYLNRGGSPSWISNIVSHFVNAQNASIGHLAFEHTLLNQDTSLKGVGGNAYLVTDPNPPLEYGNLYSTLQLLAHPLTPMKFTPLPPVFMLMVAYLVEWYFIVQHRYLSCVLRPISGPMIMLQPAVFQMCTLHIIFSDERARQEIGYVAPITTKEGFCLSLKDWNAIVEERLQEKVKEGKGGEMEISGSGIIPKAPNVH